jgi:hypothetical protein
MERKGRSNRWQRGPEFLLKQPFQGCSHRWIFDGAMASAIQRSPTANDSPSQFQKCRSIFLFANRSIRGRIIKAQGQTW